MMHPQRLVLVVVLMQLLVPAAADGLTEDDLVYSEAWGTQSACSGCSYVKGHVIEKPKEEVLQIDCICPPTAGTAPPCVCASQFDWWWNLQCAKNLSFSVSGCDEGARYDLVAGNFSGLVGAIDNAAGGCRRNESVSTGSGAFLCNSAFPSMGSTRRIEVQISFPGACAVERRAVWSLPIASDLACTNVAQVIEEVRRGNAGEIVVIIVMLLVGMCMGVVLCKRGKAPTFDEKPSRYMQQLERDSDGFEMT
mmetsp:Transcript_27266/g.43778  ORF Transcript_27266/g.43778 Transcript_27266/m.43778 type:complete len:251 (+) Transcript_27266:85-837(+)|eukprot:CAMPEP_0179438184 /NCGR_PEP_ID=MMETSP0799-20121207/21954_1 /TAXON_ID=46947 /ORGANISM="Geminigera cryophila, Strain CCMP2564" /LENGTH=250 /DNA_ID=CAMNT_0021219621 /DNA_START=85 /DNA_END=837 /DNA_ORIENTATION=+